MKAAAAVMHMQQVSITHGQIFHRALFRPVVCLKCDLCDLLLYRFGSFLSFLSLNLLSLLSWFKFTL